MSTRAANVAETRQQIVEAATRLHSEEGIVMTSWEAIASEAGLAPATVYRHFPSLAELVPACATSVFDVARLPTLEEANQKFARLEGVRERFAQLVTDSFHCYERGEAWLHAARRERDLVPAVDEVVTLQKHALGVLVRACLGPSRVSPRSYELICVLTDFPFWKSLVDVGAPRRTIGRTVLDLINAVLTKEGVPE